MRLWVLPSRVNMLISFNPATAKREALGANAATCTRPVMGTSPLNVRCSTFQVRTLASASIPPAVSNVVPSALIKSLLMEVCPSTHSSGLSSLSMFQVQRAPFSSPVTKNLLCGSGTSRETGTPTSRVQCCLTPPSRKPSSRRPRCRSRDRNSTRRRSASSHRSHLHSGASRKC